MTLSLVKGHLEISAFMMMFSVSKTQKFWQFAQKSEKKVPLSISEKTASKQSIQVQNNAYLIFFPLCASKYTLVRNCISTGANFK